MGHDGKESTSPGPRPLSLSPIDDVTCPWVMCACLEHETVSTLSDPNRMEVFHLDITWFKLVGS